MVSDAPAQVRPQSEDQTNSMPADQVMPVPGGESPVPEAAAPASETVTFDFTSIDGIRKAAESQGALRDYLTKERLDAANAERQRVLNEARRDQGANERATAWQQQLAQKYGIHLDPDDARNAPLFVKANEDWQRAEWGKAYVQAHASQFSIAENEAISAALAAVEDDPAAVNVLASKVAEAVHAKGKTDALAELDFDQLKATDPRFKEWFTAQVQREAETELNAKEIEARKTATPNVPSGGIAPEAMTRERLDAMTPDERLTYLSSLDDDGRGRMWDLAMA